MGTRRDTIQIRWCNLGEDGEVQLELSLKVGIQKKLTLRVEKMEEQHQEVLERDVVKTD